MKDVVALGNANIDFYVNSEITAKFEEKEVETMISGGGSASNTAVGCAMLGLKAGFHGFVGEGLCGKFIVEELKKNKVDISGIMFSKKPSGTVVIFTKIRSKNMFASRGANADLTKSKIDEEYINKFKHIHLATVSFDLAKYIVEKFSETHTISLDPGSTLSKYKIKELKPILKGLDIFFPNKEQIQRITNTNYLNGAKKLVEAGVKVVAVKLGKEGCYVKTACSEFDVPVVPVNVVDTTGAGDAFASGFIYGYLNDKTLKECADLGIAVSSYCVSGLGARYLPTLKEAMKLLK